MHLVFIFDNNAQTFQHQNQLEQILLYTSTIIGWILLLRHENKLFASYLKYIFQLEIIRKYLFLRISLFHLMVFCCNSRLVNYKLLHKRNITFLKLSKQQKVKFSFRYLGKWLESWRKLPCWIGKLVMQIGKFKFTAKLGRYRYSASQMAWIKPWVLQLVLFMLKMFPTKF